MYFDRPLSKQRLPHSSASAIVSELQQQDYPSAHAYMFPCRAWNSGLIMEQHVAKVCYQFFIILMSKYYGLVLLLL